MPDFTGGGQLEKQNFFALYSAGTISLTLKNL